MHKVMSLVSIVLIVFLSVPALADCSPAASEGYDGYRDAKKAYRSDDLDSCQRYAKKAYKHGSDVESYANSCS